MLKNDSTDRFIYQDKEIFNMDVDNVSFEKSELFQKLLQVLSVIRDSEAQKAEASKRKVEAIDECFSWLGPILDGTTLDEPWNPNNIKWTEAQGAKGPYQRSDDVNNLDFKRLSKDLAEHNGNLTKNGFFYWKFQNGTTIGRKQRRTTP